MFEYPLETRAKQCGVPPKRILAERLLRSVKAKSAAEKAPQVALRSVEARSVSASEYCVISQTITRLPRLFAYRWEDGRQRLKHVVDTLKRAARANLVRRMSGRFATSGQRRVLPKVPQMPKVFWLRSFAASRHPAVMCSK